MFSVVAGGTQTLRYQWRFNGNALSGATKSSLTITNVNSGGNFQVLVTNALGSITSSVATLTVVKAAEIDTQPVNQSVMQGKVALFSVTADGTGPLQYQWTQNGAVLPGATDSTLMLTNVQPGDAEQALDYALGKAAPGDAVFITGSLYLVGQLRAYWKQRAQVAAR